MRPLLAFLLLISSAAAQEIHCKHFFGSMPTGIPARNDIIFRDLYVLSNDETKFAEWVAYRIAPEETFSTLDLERKWRWRGGTESARSLAADTGGTAQITFGALVTALLRKK